MDARTRAGLNAIRESYDDLDRWRSRSRTAEQPEAASELAIDSLIWPHHPPYEVARQSLVAAVQHLNLARIAMESGEVFPTSHYTVLRGALVGAAQAVWLLGPDSQLERQQRSLRVIYEWYGRRLQYDTSIDQGSLSAADRLRLDDSISHTTTRRAQARALWQGTESLSADEKLQLTKVIAWAASFVFPRDEERSSVRLLWNLMSGDAHALGWQMAVRSQSWAKQNDGLVVGAAGGDVLDLAQPFVASFRLLRRGWSLFDQRAEAN